MPLNDKLSKTNNANIRYGYGLGKNVCYGWNVSECGSLSA